MESKCSLGELFFGNDEIFQKTKPSTKKHHIDLLEALFRSKNSVEDTYDLLFWMSIEDEAYPKKGSGYLICKPKGDDVLLILVRILKRQCKKQRRHY